LEKVRGNSGCAKHATMDFPKKKKKKKLGWKAFRECTPHAAALSRPSFSQARIRTWQLVPKITELWPPHAPTTTKAITR